MAEPARIRVSVAYAEPDHAFVAEFELPAGSTVADAIEASGIREKHPGLEIRDDRLGIFSRRAAPDAVLRDGDRVEIYRPLRIDPKEARRMRARKA
jgi:putative ubiquitin-RnfH superfamily antitoxin RatB of RatAB toxin-antitoxin module